MRKILFLCLDQSYKNLPFFSLIIPTYNRREHLQNTLDSVFAQTFTDFELIVVDDGSTDGTQQWVESQYTDERLRYFYKQNEERSVARNTGIRHANGEFIFFLDSDDELLPEHFAVLHQKINDHPGVHRFATKFMIRTEQGILSPSPIQHLPEGTYDYRLLLKGNCFNSMLCLRRQEPPVYPFPPQFRIGEDWIFMIGNTLKHPVYIIDAQTCISNDHAGRTMRGDNHEINTAKLENVRFLIREFDFSPEEQKQLWGHAYAFCAVHSYLEGTRKQGFRFWAKAVARLGLSFSLLLMAGKLLLGRKLIQGLKN